MVWGFWRVTPIAGSRNCMWRQPFPPTSVWHLLTILRRVLYQNEAFRLARLLRLCDTAVSRGMVCALLFSSRFCWLPVAPWRRRLRRADLPAPVDGATATADQLRAAMAEANFVAQSTSIRMPAQGGRGRQDPGRLRGQPSSRRSDQRAYKIEASKKSQEKVGAANGALEAYKNPHPSRPVGGRLIPFAAPRRGRRITYTSRHGQGGSNSQGTAAARCAGRPRGSPSWMRRAVWRHGTGRANVPARRGGGSRFRPGRALRLFPQQGRIAAGAGRRRSHRPGARHARHGRPGRRGRGGAGVAARGRNHGGGLRRLAGGAAGAMPSGCSTAG